MTNEETMNGSRVWTGVFLWSMIGAVMPAWADVDFQIYEAGTTKKAKVVAPGSEFDLSVLATSITAPVGTRAELDSFTYRIVFPNEDFILVSNTFSASFDSTPIPMGSNGSIPWEGLPLALANSADAGSPIDTPQVADLYRAIATAGGVAVVGPNANLETLRLRAPTVEGEYRIELDVLEVGDRVGESHILDEGNPFVLTVGPGPCLSSADCDDGDPCTRDTCGLDGFCVHDGETLAEANLVLLVAGDETHNVHSYLRTTGGALGVFVRRGSSPLLMPRGLAFGPDGSLYVSGFGSDNVLKYHWPNGGFLEVFVPAGHGGLNGPTGLTFGPDGNLYVASYDNSSVLRYDGHTGGFKGTLVRSGAGGLNHPTALVFGPDGHLYVSSFGNHSVKKYDGTSGGFLKSFVPSGRGGLNGPMGLVFGPGGYLYVASFNTDQVLRYSRTGQVEGVFVFSNPGQLDGPTGLLFDPQGNLLVASYNNDKVNLYFGLNGGFIRTLVRRTASLLSGPSALVLSPYPLCRGPEKGTGGAASVEGEDESSDLFPEADVDVPNRVQSVPRKPHE